MDFFCNSAAEGAILWGRGITISSIIIAFLSPIMGAIADNGGYRKFFLILFTCICSFFTCLLYFPQSGDVYFALTLFILAI